MRRFSIATLAVAAAAVCAPQANAGIYSDDMAKCLVKSASQEDQITFIQWMFTAMALHPSVTSMAAISDKQRTELTSKTGALFMRLITKDCRSETVAAVKYEGPNALEQSFSVLGQAAMRGLMSHPAVEKGLQGLTSESDTKELRDLMKEAGVEPPPQK